NDGLAPVQISKKSGWTYIDKSGQIVLDARYSVANTFNNNVAVALLKGKKTEFVVLTKTGHSIQVSPPVKGVPSFFNDGLVTFNNIDIFNPKSHRAWGAVNKKGKIIIKS